MVEIHPTSVIEEGAVLADGVSVGPFCHIGPRVSIGEGTTLRSHVVIDGHTTLGKFNELWPGAVVGSAPQDLKYGGEPTRTVIGDHNDIREAVTIHRGTAKDAGVTTVGSHNLLMAYCHVGHDCTLGDHLVIANAIQFAGHVVIEDHAVIGGATAIHHFTTIGQYSFIGGMTRVVKDVPPFMKVEGNPARVRMYNDVGLSRHGFEPGMISAIKDAFRRLYRGGAGGDDDASNGTILKTAAALERDYRDNWAIKALVENIRHSAAGVHGRYREAQRRDNKFHNPVK